MPRWGMVIDLDKMCGLPGVHDGCKAENNVPHGTPEEQRSRRDIFWNKLMRQPPGNIPGSIRSSSRCRACSVSMRLCDGLPGEGDVSSEDGIVVQDFRRCLGCKLLHRCLPLWGAKLQQHRARGEAVPSSDCRRQKMSGVNGPFRPGPTGWWRNAPSVFIGSTKRSRRQEDRDGSGPCLCGGLPFGGQKIWRLGRYRQ